jgi:hypothetical protein
MDHDRDVSAGSDLGIQPRIALEFPRPAPGEIDGAVVWHVTPG